MIAAPPKNAIDSEIKKWKSQNRNKKLKTDIIETIHQEWNSKDKVCKLLGFFATVRLQQDWKAAENNPSLLRDCPWKHFLQKMREYYKPTENFIIRNYEFCQLSQMPNETFSAFCNRVEAAGNRKSGIMRQKKFFIKVY